MPDGLDFSYSDPRFLRQKIKALEKDIEALKKQVMPFAIHQRGSVVGAMRAIAINDQGLKASMWMNFTNIGPGQGPYQAVTDANGIIRVELGNLAANGISPAQEGVRANKADGTPLFDSLGLISVMQPLGSSFLGSIFSTSSATPVLVTGSAVTFTLARALRVDARYAASCSYSGAGTGTAFVDLFVDNANQSAGGNGPAIELQFAPTSSGAATSGASFSLALAAGSHTIDLRASQNGTPSMSLTQAVLIIYQLGS